MVDIRSHDATPTQTYCLVPIMHLEYDLETKKYAFVKCYLEIESPLTNDTKLDLRRTDFAKTGAKGDPLDSGIYFTCDIQQVNLFSGRPELFLLDLYNSILTHEDFVDDLHNMETFLTNNDYQLSKTAQAVYAVTKNIKTDNTMFNMTPSSEIIFNNFSDSIQCVRKMKKAKELQDYIDYLFKGVDFNIKNKMYTHPALYEKLIQLFHNDPDFFPFWREIYFWGDRKQVENHILLNHLNTGCYLPSLFDKITEKFEGNFYIALNFSADSEDAYYKRLQRLNTYYEDSHIVPDVTPSILLIQSFGFVTHMLKQKPNEICRSVKEALYSMCHKSSVHKRQMDLAILNVLNNHVDNSLALLIFVKNFEELLKLINEEKGPGYNNIYNFAVILETAYHMFKNRVKSPRGFIHMVNILDKYVHKVAPKYRHAFVYDQEKLNRIDKVFDLSLGLV